jgi:hypothetical protein
MPACAGACACGRGVEAALELLGAVEVDDRRFSVT